MSPIYERPRPALTADVVLLREGAETPEVLLIRRGSDPFAGAWALPGGFVEPEEELEAAARRELAEETGIRRVELEQIAAFGTPGRDPRGWVVSVAFWGWLTGEAETSAGDDAAEARWWPLNSLPALAFDHGEILERTRRRVREVAQLQGRKGARS